MTLKKHNVSTVSAAALLACTASTAAVAQSNVALYGIVDAGVAYVSNTSPSLGSKGGSAVIAESGGGAPSRWGLRGTEDLGGGYSAVFTLENGFSAMSGALGQGGRLFGRQAFVGVKKDSLGLLTLGRQYDPYFDLVGSFTSARQWGGIYGAHVGDVDNTFASFRFNNAVRYASLNLYGFVVSGMYAFSNQASGAGGTGFSNNSAWSTAIGYSKGPLQAGAGYFHLSHPSSGNANGSNTGGAIAGDYSPNTGIFFSNAVASQDVAGAGASYQISSLTLAAYYSHTQLKYVDTTQLNLSNFELGGRYSFTPALSGGLGAIYTQGNMTGTNLKNVVSGPHPKWIQFNAGLNYALSKRTNLYGVAVYQRAMGDAKVAAINLSGGPTVVGVHHQVAVVMGVTQKF